MCGHMQGVHENIQFMPAKTKWEDGKERVNKLVFIGKGLDRDSLQKQFNSCLADLPDGGVGHGGFA